MGLMPIDREGRLQILHARIRACTKCVVAGYIGRARPVVAGSIRDRIGIVGQAPGAVELTTGQPFSGRSGAELRRWLAEGTDAIEHVLTLTGRWLGILKTQQAQAALERFRAQVRLKGGKTQCVRGHPYTQVAMRAGRLRRICDTCDLLSERRQRARRGIPPRRFKNVARRYTF